ncbi:hypothetical protein [Spirosoma oryzicola]|uniref:hypothetical protein n=1 Tax=Spirosoma oryzicola TaxID=2898794 RepID=UPI001E5D4CD3|nr:hypothetical protein [Spirosoma oryzicola]UHG92484.1 hypothetical protein LQ777_06150 [Spirosoma oryzicola]
MNIQNPSKSLYGKKFNYTHVSLSTRAIALTLFGIAFLFVIISFAGMYARLYASAQGFQWHRYIEHLIDKTYVDSELNIPTFYNACLLLLSSVLLQLAKLIKGPSQVKRQHWSILSIIFLLLAMDESTSFHELLNVSTLQGNVPASKYLHWTWVIPGMLFVVAVFVFFIPFLLALPRRTASLMILAGATYVGGAIGLEVIGSAVIVDEGFFNLHYSLVTHLEELMEMTGLVVFIYCLLDYISKKPIQATVTFN